MRSLLRVWSLLLFSLPCLALATAEPFKAGTDYIVLKSASSATHQPATQISVQEFFSYGCPACFHFESTLEPWLAQKPKYVAFDRVPVVFHSDWVTYAKAYYTAKTLGVLDKIHSDLFNAVQKQGKNLTTEQAMSLFFGAHGVKHQDFAGVYNFLPGITMQLQQGTQLMRQYEIMEVPTLVIAGKYKLNLNNTQGDTKRLLQILDYLIQKERLGN